MLLNDLERWNLRWISTDRSSQYYHWNKTMKLTLTLITIVVGMLLIEESSPIKSSQKDDNSVFNNNYEGVWQQGKEAYEISQQFGEPSLIYCYKTLFIGA